MFDAHTQFANPGFLWLLAVLPLYAAWYFWRGRRGTSSLRHSSLEAFAGTPAGWRVRLRYLPFIIRVIAVAALIVGFARPQSTAKGENVFREGIDITLAVDISGSMLAEDFRPNRLEAAKDVAAEFIRGRMNDRIGLVIFSGESFTQCPLTTDYDVLTDLLKKVKMGNLKDGTAIGEGIATAVSRMRTSKAKSKVMILLTDGINNMGSIDPLTAAQIAAQFGIRIYCIGVGTRGMAPYPVKTPYGIVYQQMPVEIDEAMLQQVSDATGGKYFRATSNRKLAEIYEQIDALERTKIEVTEFRRYKELFSDWALLGAALLALELLLSSFVFRKIP
ncbi:MAG: VWA domain-containing protein [Ignavibacteriae bacterium]|nr:VWA domain-containing protein [Ignavibacteriota bacterium]